MKVRHWVLLLVFIWLGLALRLHQIDTVALRGDEAFSAQNWAGLPLATSLREIASIEPHPPGTYAFFRLWGISVGLAPELALRLLPALTNLLGIVAMYALGKRLTRNRAISLLAAFFFAIHPFEIWHAQDFRNYATWAGLSVVALWLGLRVIQGQRKPLDWGLYAIIQLAAVFIFYDELLTMGILTLFAFWTQRENISFIIRWLGLQIVLGLLTTVAFVILQGDLISGGGYGGTTAGGLDLPRLLTWFLPTLTFGETVPYASALSGVILLVLIGCGAVVWRKSAYQGVFLVLLAIVPMIALAIVSTRMKIFAPRYIMNAIPAYLLLVAAAIVYGRNKRILSASLFIGWALLSGASLANHYYNPEFQKAKDWPVLAAYLAENTAPDDVVIQTGIDAAFVYYYDLYDIETEEFALPIEPDQPIPEITAYMEQTAEAGYRSFWIVGQTFPDWPNEGVVEDWAFEHWQLVRDTRAAGLPARQFMPWEVRPDEVRDETIAILGDVVELVDARIFAPEPTDELTVWLYWQPIEPSQIPLTGFVHLVGDINPATGTPLWSQDDHPPQNGRISTTTWVEGELYRDVYVLPLDDVVAADYQLYVGLYDPETGERLIAEDGADSVLIGAFDQ